MSGEREPDYRREAETYDALVRPIHYRSEKAERFWLDAACGISAQALDDVKVTAFWGQVTCALCQMVFRGDRLLANVHAFRTAP